MDQHLLNTIIAGAILDCARDRQEKVKPEEAKRTAKCIVVALENAGFQISPKQPG